jgi:hypothetical protein
VNGTYVRAGDGAHDGFATLQLSNKGVVSVRYELFNSFGSHSSASGAGEGKLRANEMVFTPTDADASCKITVAFLPANVVQFTQQGESGACLMGNGVSIDDRYVKVRGGKLPGGPDYPGRGVRSEDPKELSQLAADAAEETRVASSVIASKDARIAELAATRKALQRDLSASKKELESRLKAGAAAVKKRDAALAKTNANPTAATLQATAKTEYSAARDAGRAALKLAAQLRDVEDELAQLAAESNQAGVDAQLGSSDLRKALAKLTAMATKERDEAKKAASAAGQDAAKGSTLVGVTGAQLTTAREKADVELAKLGASLKETEAALKGAKR